MGDQLMEWGPNPIRNSDIIKEKKETI